MRELSGLKSAQLARDAGISRSYMCDLELGRRWPTPTVVKLLAKALKCPPVMIARHKRGQVAS